LNWIELSAYINLTLTVVTTDLHVVQLVDAQSNLTRTLSVVVVPSVECAFVVQARHIGIARLVLHVSADPGVVLATADYAVRVSRKWRDVDGLFTWAVMAQAMFNAFAAGCGADWRRIKRHLTTSNLRIPFAQQLVLLSAVRCNKPTANSELANTV